RPPRLPTLFPYTTLFRSELKHPYRYRRYDVVGRTLELVDDDAVILSFEPGALRTVRRLRPGLRTIQHVGFGVSIRRAAGAWAVRSEEHTSELQSPDHLVC